MSSPRCNRQLRRKTRRYRQRGLPDTMLEVFAVPLVLFVMSTPVFGIKDWPLPPIDQAPITKLHNDAQIEPIVLAITANGRVTCKGEPSSVSTFVDDTRRMLKPQQKIRLIVQAGKDGAGNVTTYTQVLAALSRTDLWNRTILPCKSSTAAVPQSDERSSS